MGGDFYDAFQADANWWIVAVGDVCGHGVEAAATTGLVRHTIRSSAMGGVMPSTVLTRLNEMLLRSAAERDEVDDDRLPLSPRFCTVLVGAVQPTDRGVDIILCSGGHPLPLVRRSVGRADPVGVPGTLLGVTDDVSLTDTVVHLDPGESLVCYTDGLMERRVGAAVVSSEEGIVKAMLQGKGLWRPTWALIESEAVAFVDDDPGRDMAVLVLRAPRPELPDRLATCWERALGLVPRCRADGHPHRDRRRVPWTALMSLVTLRSVQLGGGRAARQRCAASQVLARIGAVDPVPVVRRRCVAAAAGHPPPRADLLQRCRRS